MYGGTEDLFSQPVMATPPPPAAEPEPVAEVAATEVASGPTLPATGLPEGWTMEQWQHYGEEYLRRQGDA